jgi:hypothetical protein
MGIRSILPGSGGRTVENATLNRRTSIMKPIHALLIAGAMAFGVVLGVTAVTKTSTLGASARHASAAAIVNRTHRLDSFEAALQRALKKRPPRLPAAPTASAAAAPAGAASIPTAAVSAASPRVIYQRPAPIIVHKHGRFGGDGAESEGGGYGGHGSTGPGEGAGHDD